MKTIELYRPLDDGTEIRIFAKFRYVPFRRGYSDGGGPPLEPDEPEQAVFEYAVTENGDDIELTDYELEQATIQALEEYQNEHQS